MADNELSGYEGIQQAKRVSSFGVRGIKTLILINPVQ